MSAEMLEERLLPAASQPRSSWSAFKAKRRRQRSGQSCVSEEAPSSSGGQLDLPSRVPLTPSEPTTTISSDTKRAPERPATTARGQRRVLVKPHWRASQLSLLLASFLIVICCNQANLISSSLVRQENHSLISHQNQTEKISDPPNQRKQTSPVSTNSTSTSAAPSQANRPHPLPYLNSRHATAFQLRLGRVSFHSDERVYEY